MEKCIMNEVFDGVFGGVVGTKDSSDIIRATESATQTISDIKDQLLHLISICNSGIYQLRSTLNIPLQDRNDEDYILNWCDMNYANSDIRPSIDVIYQLIDMKNDIKVMLWQR
jgi:hypothetical protein